MSNFTRNTINPDSGQVEMAEWLDNHYGPNRYGVRFQDGEIYPEEVVKQPLPWLPTEKGREMKVRILEGWFKETVVDVIEDGAKSIKVELNGCTVRLPKDSILGIKYYEEVTDDE